MTTQVIKFVASIALMGYIFLALFSLAGLSSHMHSDMPMQNCPYALGTHSLCPMDVFGHIQAWESAMAAIIPSLVLLVVIAIVFVSHIPQLANGPSVPLRRRRLRQYSPYTFLFSEGILNPKAP